MAERDKLVYIVLDEANRPTSLGAFEDGDTIASGTLSTNVRDAVDNVGTLNTRVDNLDTSVGDLSAAIDAVAVGAIPAAVSSNWQAAYEYTSDASADIAETSARANAVSSLADQLLASSNDLSTYISDNEGTWSTGGGLDPATLADITAVSTVVSNTSGANDDIVTSYGPFSGEASGVSGAAAVFASVNGTTAVLNRNFNFNSKTITNAGTINGISITTLDSQLTTNTGNIATNTTDITNLGAASGDWTTGYNLATDLISLSGEGFLNGSNPTLNTTLTGTGEVIIDGGLSGGPLSSTGSIRCIGTLRTESNIQAGGSITAANNITTTTGNITATNGNLIAGGYLSAVGNSNINGTLTVDLDVTADSVSVTGLNADVTALGGRVTTAESDITNLTTSSDEISGVVSTLTTSVTNISNKVTNLTTSSAQLSGAIDTLNGTLTNVEGSTVALSSYINANEATWNAGSTGIDPDLLADIQAVSTVVTTTSGANDDIVTSYGPYSGLASGVSAAGATIASISTGLATLKRSLSLNNIYSIVGISTISTEDVRYTGNLSGEGDLSSNGNFYGGTLNGIDVTALEGRVTTAETDITDLTTSSEGLSGAIDTLDAYVTDLATSSEEVSAVVAINTGNIATLTATVTSLEASTNFPVTSLNNTLNANNNNITEINQIITNNNPLTIKVQSNTDGENFIISNTSNNVIGGNPGSINIRSVGSLQLSSGQTTSILAGTISINDGTFITNDFGACCLNWNSNYDTAQGYDTVGWDATKTIVDANVIGGELGSSGLRIGGTVYPIDQTTPPANNNLLKYNSSSSKWVLGTLAFEVDGGTGVATPVSEITSFNYGNASIDIQNNLNVSSPSGTVTFGSQQTFTPSSNTFATRNILIGNELSSGPECVVNLEGSTIWASGSVLSAGSGCDITLRGDKFFYGPTNIYGPLGTHLDLDGNNIIDVNNITTGNAPLTLQVTGSVTAGNLNIKNTASGITAGNVDIDAVGDITLSSPNTISMEAATVTLDGTGLFGLSGGAVGIESTATYITVDSAAYLNITAATNLNLNSADNGTQSVNIDGCPFPNPFIQIKADTGLNINSAANVAVTFSGVDVSGGGKVANHYSYNFGTTPTSVQVDTAGIYEIGFNIMVYDPASTVAQRSTHIAQITKNGTVVGSGAIGYVRSNSGSNEASYNMNGYIINLASGDDIGVNFERVATTTSTTEILPGYDHILTIKRIG